MADSINLLKLPGYNDISNIILDRIFKAVLLPILKDLIQERMRSSGISCIDTILKEHHYKDIVPAYSWHTFKIDKMNDFRFALKIVAFNKIGCFTEKEVELCDKLRKSGNIFVHTSEISSEFVTEVLALTKNLLSTISIKTDLTNYDHLLKDIEHLVETKF